MLQTNKQASFFNHACICIKAQRLLFTTNGPSVTPIVFYFCLGLSSEICAVQMTFLCPSFAFLLNNHAATTISTATSYPQDCQAIKRSCPIQGAHGCSNNLLANFANVA